MFPGTDWVDDDEDFPRGTHIEAEAMRGIAFRVLECEFAGEQVHARMVGDDRIHTLWRDEIKKIDREDFCAECGQIGCTHDGLERN